MKYIVKLFSEITIKSKPVRKRFIMILAWNLWKTLKYHKVEARVIKCWDRIEIESDKKYEEKINFILSNLPWVNHFFNVEEYDFDEIEFEKIYDIIEEYFLEKIKWQKFAVRIKRSWAHSFSSWDIERFIWWKLCKKLWEWNAKVNLKNPDILVSGHLIDNKFLLIKQRIDWLWGFPSWTQGKALSLISWGFDSPVASYLMMKRGLILDYVFFNLWWDAHEIWVKKLTQNIWERFSPSYNAKFITVDLRPVVKEIIEKVSLKNRGVILKRLFYYFSDKIAQKWWYNSFITWEAIWQVSSQTIINLSVIEKDISSLVIRPVIAMDKPDIIDTAREIWTYDFSANMPEYCWVISQKPTISADLDEIRKEFDLIDKNVLAQIEKDIKLTDIREVFNWENKKMFIESVNYFDIKEEDIIIDIREPLEIKSNPLEFPRGIIEIPFYDINSKFATLDQSKSYLFYCNKWVISNLHALYLKEKGFNNIKIYRD